MISMPPVSPIRTVRFRELLYQTQGIAKNQLPSQLNGSKDSFRATAHQGKNLARRRYQKGQLLLIGTSWYGRWYVDTIEGGKLRRHRPQTFLGTVRDYATRRLARRALDERLANINSLAYRPRPTISFSEFATKWESSILGQFKASTSENYRIHIRRHLTPFFGCYGLKDIQSELVQQFIASKTASPKTIRNIVVTLQSMWRIARAWGYVAHDIFDGVLYPPPRRANRFFFSVEDVQRIVGAAKEPHRMFYGLLAESGCRVGELCGLTVDDLDLERNLLAVRQSAWRGRLVGPKTANSVRVVNLSRQCVENLRAFLACWRPNENRLLFSTRNGTPWDANMLRKRQFRSLLKELNIPIPKGNGFHAFRHANAALMDRLAVPMKVRQQRLGHSDPRMTLGVYTHVVGEDSETTAQQIGALVWNQKPKILDADGRKLKTA
jgi:integrase